MKYQVALFSLAGTLFLFGCQKKEELPTPQPEQPASGNPLTAPVDYLAAAGRAQQSAVKTVDTAAIKSALQHFYVGEGRYPKDLNELVSKQYLPQIPTPPHGTKIDYNPATGDVKIVKQ